MKRIFSIGESVYLKGTLLKGKVEGIFDDQTIYVSFKEDKRHHVEKLSPRQISKTAWTVLSEFLKDLSRFMTEKLKLTPLQLVWIIFIQFLINFLFCILIFLF